MPALTNSSKKRAAADENPEQDQSSSSPRRSKRTRKSVNAITTTPPKADTLEGTDKPEKLARRVTTGKGAGRGTSHIHTKDSDIKIEQDRSIVIKAQTTRVTEATEDVVKKEIGVEEEHEILPKKTTKKGASKEEKAAEMEPLAARTKGLQMFVGAHVSAAKGVQNSVINSVHIGGNAFALFLKSQRKWDNPPLQDEHREQFRKFCLDQQYDAAKYILPHGSYLVNLAREDKGKAKQAYDSFLDDLERCEQLGIRLYNFHPGAVGQSTLEAATSRLAQALTKALSATSTVTPVLETMCGHGTTIGGPLAEIGAVISKIPKEYHSRIGVCIDTCHSFAYGYDLVSVDGFKSFMQEFDDKIGIQFLRALHLNDSKAPRGSKRDLHANIGTGFLGLRAFHNVMNEERFQGLPMILETPIDRPNPALAIKSRQPTEAAEEADTDGEPESDSAPKAAKQKKKPQKKQPANSKMPPTIEDKGVWAREIKLLESLIGMDTDSPEFRSLEAELSEAGRAEREKHQGQYEKKLEAEARKKKKEVEKGQKCLADMFKTKETR